MFHKLTLALGVAMILGSTALPAQEAANTPAAPKQQEIKFSFTDTHGQKIEIVPTEKGLSYPPLEGKKVLAMFFIYSGTPCRNELQMFTRLRSKYPDLAFVAFELKGHKPDQLKAFEKELKLEGIHLIDTAQAMPFARYIAKAAGWQGSVPLIIVSDAKGEVKHMQLGALSPNDLQKVYEKL